MEEIINELANELKCLLSEYPNNRLDLFPNDCDDIFACDGEEWELFDFKIYSGSSWHDDDACYVTSVFVDDDELYFDLSRYDDYNGGEVEKINGVWIDYIINRSYFHYTLIEETLQLIISILKKQDLN